jgi:hypothetical protein
LVSLPPTTGSPATPPKPSNQGLALLTVTVAVAQLVKLYFLMVPTPLFGALLVFPPIYSAARTLLVAEAMAVT